MSNRTKTNTDAVPEAAIPVLPDRDLRVDFGVPAPGSANPMPAKKRRAYEQRIRRAVELQAAGAERAAQVFIR